MSFELRSPAFGNLDRIPVKYTADGDNLSPPLTWFDPPPGTKSFALVVEDPDAPARIFRHWGIFNIDPETRGLAEGVGDSEESANLRTGVNDFGTPRYDGPAPPKGRGAHRYHFKLVALSVAMLTPAPKIKVAEISKIAKMFKLGEAELVGIYER
jgi:Raf kinase inhibitor-like YbhB/YbcL family protein